MTKINSTHPAMVSLASVGLYCCFFVMFYSILEDAVLPITLIPILTISWIYGIPGALFVAPIMVLINWLMFYWLGDIANMYQPMSIVGHLMIFVAALITAKFSSINKQLVHSLAHRDELKNVLYEQKSLYQALFESAGDAVFIVAPKPNGPPVFLDCNDATVSFFNCKLKSDIIDKSPMDFSPEIQPNGIPSGQMISELGQKVMAGEPQVFEWLHQLPDDSRLWGEVNLSLIEIGNDRYMQAIVRNIEDRKQAELKHRESEIKLRQSQKMEAIGILTGGIAHEFNNLLVPILGYSELMLKKDKYKDDQKMITNIQNAADRAKRLVQQMLAYGRHSVSQFEAINLVVLIEETLAFISKTIPESIEVKTEFNEIPNINAMSNEMHQVLINLCINAGHAMPEGGLLLIKVENVGYQKFSSREGNPIEGEFIDLSVTDTGTGMPESVVCQIFDPFFTTKDIGKGSGLGLSVVQGIVEQHNGHIEVESELDKGTTFHIYLPIVLTTTAKQGSDREYPVDLDTSDYSILLVDDDEMVANLTSEMLTELGFNVRVSNLPNDAINLFSNEPDNYDLILSDYGMPGMSGKELSEAIHTIRADIPIILVTGYGNTFTQDDIAQWGFDGVIEKPFNIADMTKIINQTLHSDKSNSQSQ